MRGPSVQQMLNAVPQKNLSSLLACPEPAGTLRAGKEHRTIPEVITLLLYPPL